MRIILFIVALLLGTCVVISEIKLNKASSLALTKSDQLKQNKSFKIQSSHGREGDDATAIHIPYYHFQLLARSIYLFLLFLPVVSTSGLAYVSRKFRNVLWYKLLCWALSKGGAAMIKWSQWASTRPDMFPEELCNILSDLQANAPTHSFAFTERQITAELGKPINAIFDYFDKTPVASGSIAQVYRARMDGRDVAVKVRHPDVEIQIKLDFIIMKFLASVIERLPGLGWLHLSESLTQFSHTIAAQTRLDIEGKHLEIFNENYRTWDDVFFPSPLILTDSVLVESFEQGISVAKFVENFPKGAADFTQLMQNPVDQAAIIGSIKSAHTLVTRGEDLYLKMLLQDNLMHADLHPGNILLQRRGATTQASGQNRNMNIDKLVLVDAGMVAELDQKEQRNFIGLMESLGEGDALEAAEYVLDFSSAGSSSYTDELKNSFRQDMVILFSQVCKGYGHKVSIGEVLRGVLALVRKHNITIEANYATLVMNALCLESMALAILPAYNVLDGGKSLLRLNRICKKFGPLAPFCQKFFLPLGQWMKRRDDRKFIRELEQRAIEVMHYK